MSNTINTFEGIKPILKKTYADDKKKKPKFGKLKKLIDGK